MTVRIEVTADEVRAVGDSGPGIAIEDKRAFSSRSSETATVTIRTVASDRN